MNRRDFLTVTAATLASALFMSPVVALAGQDFEYIRALERAQQQRPAALTTSARIAPSSEPGTPLVLRGRIVKADGSPAANAIVFAYHTDRAGLYDRRENGPHSWRLKGWARAAQDGTFSFETIRPGSYPDSRNPAHVHFTAFLPGGERYHAGEIQFANDPLIPAGDRESGARDEFAHVRPVRTEGKTEHVTFALRIEPRNKF
jgi:protocatechuate 3,4-dioxygenase beta subunit